MKLTVLIIEDDENISNFISALLESNDYKTILCKSGSTALTLSKSHCPDVILLDLGLPDVDGQEVLRTLRSFTTTPIIVISARHDEREKVTALDSGADDYITKPFGTEELMARIRAALRHKKQSDLLPSTMFHYQAKGLEIDFDKRLVTLLGETIRLTQIEYKLVSLLAENSGRVVTYEAIIKALWGPNADTDNQILRVNMANIRRKIEKNAATPVYINTEVGVGYRMLDNELE